MKVTSSATTIPRTTVEELQPAPKPAGETAIGQEVPAGGPGADAFERMGGGNGFGALMGNAPVQASVGDGAKVYEELSGAAKRKVGDTAEAIKKGSLATVEADVRKSLSSNPGQFWNMMQALEASDPAAYAKATEALRGVFTNPQGLDLGKVIEEPFKKAPELLADTLGKIAGADGAAAGGVKKALEEQFGRRGLSYDTADLNFLRAAKGAGEGWGNDVLRNTLGEHVANRTGHAVKGMDAGRAERLVAVQADASGYLKELEAKKRYDRGGYEAELKMLQQDVLRPGLQGAENLFVALDRVGGRIPANDRPNASPDKTQPMNVVKTDILRHLQTNLKESLEGGRPELAAGNAEQMSRLLRHPGVARFMLEDQKLGGELRAMMSSIAGVNAGMGQKLVGSVIDQGTRETADILRRTDSRTFKGSDEAKHATRQLGLLLAAGQDALAKTLPGKSAGTFVMKQLATTLLSLVPGGKVVEGAAGKIGEIALDQIKGKVGEVVDYGLGKALDAVEDTSKPFEARLTAVAESLFHIVYDPRGEVRNADLADPSSAERRKEYSRDAMDFAVELNNGYEAYKSS